MKKLTKALVLILVFTLLSTNAHATTMYAPDGRSINVDSYDVHTWENAGWYSYPVVAIYAPDGRAMTVSADSVSSFESVGWIDGRKTIQIYSVDGSTATIPLWQLESYKSVGWYDYPVVAMYSPDGRCAVVNAYSVSQWESVGWIDGRKTTTIYAAGGKEATIPLWQLQSYLALGWSEYPTVYYNVYYPGTNIPTYEYVTGGYLYNGPEYADGAEHYYYYSDYSSKSYYIDFLEYIGFEYIDSEVEDDYSIFVYTNYYDVVAVSYLYDMDIVIISIGNIYSL